jgi:uncharacterized protein (DUF1684 family)
MTIQATDYPAEIATWRTEIEVPLRRDWISLAGRYELSPGLHRIGADPSSEIVLPAGAAPDHVGTLHVADGVVTLSAAAGVALLVNGAPITGSVTLRSDAEGTPDLVAINTLTFFLIQRGPRTIVRLRDANSPALATFGGRRWFPVDETYRVEGVFTPYDPPKPLAITNLLGDTSEQTSPGSVAFTLGGQSYTLDATGWREGGLVLHFRDATNGSLTYGGGRALVTAPPASGLVTLDFNRTSNLPCAFTEFATCPLPPAQNRLTIRVEAGELLP